jgi:hypothetical protein
MPTAHRWKLGPDYFGLTHNTIKALIQELPRADTSPLYIWQEFFEDAGIFRKGVERKRKHEDEAERYGMIEASRHSNPTNPGTHGESSESDPMAHRWSASRSPSSSYTNSTRYQLEQQVSANPYNLPCVAPSSSTPIPAYPVYQPYDINQPFAPSFPPQQSWSDEFVSSPYDLPGGLEQVFDPTANGYAPNPYDLSQQSAF